MPLSPRPNRRLVEEIGRVQKDRQGVGGTVPQSAVARSAPPGARKRHSLAAMERSRHGRWRQAARSVARIRSEEHTSELQSLMRTSYAVFCLKKKNNRKQKESILLLNIRTN